MWKAFTFNSRKIALKNVLPLLVLFVHFSVRKVSTKQPSLSLGRSSTWLTATSVKVILWAHCVCGARALVSAIRNKSHNHKTFGARLFSTTKITSSIEWKESYQLAPWSGLRALQVGSKQETHSSRPFERTQKKSAFGGGGWWCWLMCERRGFHLGFRNPFNQTHIQCVSFIKIKFEMIIGCDPVITFIIFGLAWDCCCRRWLYEYGGLVCAHECGETTNFVLILKSRKWRDQRLKSCFDEKTFNFFLEHLCFQWFRLSISAVACLVDERWREVYVLWSRQSQTTDDLSNFAISTRIPFDKVEEEEEEEEKDPFCWFILIKIAAKRFFFFIKETPWISEQARCVWMTYKSRRRMIIIALWIVIR